MTSKSDNRTTELLPCPFCGGEAEVCTWYGGGEHNETVYTVMCDNDACEMNVTTADHLTEAEAKAAWNARAERTCCDASVDSSTQFYCSACECTVDVPLLWGELNYCPNCGAKVIAEVQ